MQKTEKDEIIFRHLRALHKELKEKGYLEVLTLKCQNSETGDVDFTRLDISNQ